MFYFISNAAFDSEIRDVMGPNSPKATNKVNVRMCDVRNPRLAEASQSATDESLAFLSGNQSPRRTIQFFRGEHGQIWHSQLLTISLLEVISSYIIAILLIFLLLQ